MLASQDAHQAQEPVQAPGDCAVVGAIAINILVACRCAMPDRGLMTTLEPTEKSLLPLLVPFGSLWAGRGLSR